MKKIILFISCLGLIAGCSIKYKTQNKPNIIVILLDDAGYIDFGFMGSEDLDTPNIDQLASSGVVFTDAHVSATVCAPSRAGIMTGRYQQRFGFEANHTGDKQSGDIGLDKNIPTMAEIFKENGYHTAAIGKWHLGEKEHNHPNNRGFDDFFGFIGGGRSYFPIKNPNHKQMLQHNGKRVKFDGYLTDVFGDFSADYVEEHKDQPFLMYLAYNAVHAPMHAKKEDLEKYKDHPRQKLAAMTWSLDQNIGKLTQKLEELHLDENTLIFFLSDNGGAYNNTSKNGILKGCKGNKFEGGHRVPFVVSWPKMIAANKKFDGLSSSLDILSTVLSAANIKDERKDQLDGVNLLPYLSGTKKGNPHETLYWRKLDEAAIRHKNHKLIRLKDYGTVLYNLKEDISEKKNLKEQEPETLGKLSKQLKQWEEGMMPPLWKEQESWMKVTRHIHERLMENKKVLYRSPKQMKKGLKNKNETL